MYQVFTQQHMHRLRLVWHATDIIRSIAFICTMWGFDFRGNFLKPATPTSMNAAFHQSTLPSFSPTQHIFLSKWRHSRINYMAQPDAAEVFHVCCCDSKKQSFIKAGVFHNVICEDTQYSMKACFTAATVFKNANKNGSMKCMRIQCTCNFCLAQYASSSVFQYWLCLSV